MNKFCQNPPISWRDKSADKADFLKRMVTVKIIIIVSQRHNP